MEAAWSGSIPGTPPGPVSPADMCRRRTRPDQATFRWVSCDYCDHADVNAAKNICTLSLKPSKRACLSFMERMEGASVRTEVFREVGRRARQERSSMGRVRQGGGRGEPERSAGVVGARAGKKSLPVGIHVPGEPGRKVVGSLPEAGAGGQVVGECRVDVETMERLGGKESGDPCDQGGGPGGSGSPEVLSTRDRMAESPLAGVVVERNFGMVEEAGESVPVGEKTLHRLETGKGGGEGRNKSYKTRRRLCPLGGIPGKCRCSDSFQESLHGRHQYHSGRTVFRNPEV